MENVFQSAFSVPVFSTGFDGLDLLKVFLVGVDLDGSSIAILETSGAVLRPELASAIRSLDTVSIRP